MYILLPSPLSVNVSVAPASTWITLPVLCNTRRSINPFRSSVDVPFATRAAPLMSISFSSTIPDTPFSNAVLNSCSVVTRVGVVPSAVSTKGLVTSPDVTKAAHMGSAHTNTRVIIMGSSRLFMAVPPSISQCSSPVPLCRRISHEEISNHPQALLYDHLTRKCRERQREYPDVGITNPRTNH